MRSKGRKASLGREAGRDWRLAWRRGRPPSLMVFAGLVAVIQAAVWRPGRGPAMTSAVGAVAEGGLVPRFRADEREGRPRHQLPTLLAPFFRALHYVAMIRSAVLLSAVFLALPLAAAAAGAPPGNINAAFGNTVLIIDPDGRSRKVWLRPDGTWTGLSRRGLNLAGTWTVQGAKLCLKQSKPRLFGRMCESFPTEPDVSISATDPAGKTVHLKLVKGRVTK